MSSSDKPNQVITKLWESLARGGHHWGRDVLLTEEEAHFQCFFYLEQDLPTGAASHIQNYVKTFLEQEGWKAKTKFTKRYLRMDISRA